MITWLRRLFTKLQVMMLVSSILVMQSSSSNADELYKFFSIDCVPELGTLQIDAFQLWNVGRFVWPSAPNAGTDNQKRWEKHVANLRELEEKYGFYVIGEAYGRWDEQPVDCKIDRNTARITFEKIEVETGIVGEGTRIYRGAATINIINNSGQTVWKHRLRSEHATFQIYNSGVLYLLCDHGQTCEPQNSQSVDFPP